MERAKGVLAENAPMLGANAAVTECNDFEKSRSDFYLISLGALRGLC
jgi:hypothetical protein